MQTGPARERILPLDQLRERLHAAREAGRRVVFTNGCFDLLHAGHVTLLERAAALGDLLVVGLNSDDSVRRLKGAPRPLMPQVERAELLAALRPVDYVIVFEEDTPAELVEALVPDVLVKGEDYARQEIVGRETVEAHGGEVVRIPLVAGLSTSALLERFRQES